VRPPLRGPPNGPDTEGDSPQRGRMVENGRRDSDPQGSRRKGLPGGKRCGRLIHRTRLESGGPRPAQ